VKLKTLSRPLILCAIFTFGFLASLPQTQAASTVTKRFPTTLFEGASTATNAVYASARTASQGNPYPYTYSTYNVSLLAYLGQDWDGLVFGVYRAFWTFDTHMISASDEVTGASLKFQVYADLSDQDFDIQLDIWTDERQVFNTSDFSLKADAVYGSLSTNSLSLTGFNTIQLTDVSLVQKGSYTTICLRSSHDISGIPPVGATDERVLLWGTTPIEPTKQPYLEVSYVEKGGSSGPKDEDWVPLTIPNIPLHARRVLEWVQQQFREREELRAVVGLGLIMVVGGVIVKWDRKGKRKLQL